MAVTRLSDLVVPSVFAEYVQIESAEKSAFRNSGVLQDSPLLTQLLSGGARQFSVPHFRDLDQTESNVSSDNPVDTATPQNIGTGTEVAQRHNRNQVWSSMDLNEQLIGPDPLQAIASRVATYWTRQEQRMVISALQGIFADNIANDSEDMVNSITIGSSGTPSATNLFSAEAVIDAQQTLGDSAEDLAAIAMHSVVFARAKKNNLIDFIPDSRGVVDIPFFLGLRVIVDDGLPVVTNGSNTEYSSYLFGAGSILRGVGSPRVPVETDRSPDAGNGGGQESLYSRVEWSHHPRGFAWQTASQAGESPTNSELTNAANWDRVYPERKQIKLASLVTNG